METKLLTPRNSVTNERVKFQIDELGMKLFDSLESTRKWVVLRDFVTKKDYKVRKASCGSPNCNCDAVYKEI